MLGGWPEWTSLGLFWWYILDTRHHWDIKKDFLGKSHCHDTVRHCGGKKTITTEWRQPLHSSIVHRGPRHTEHRGRERSERYNDTVKQWILSPILLSSYHRDGGSIRHEPRRSVWSKEMLRSQRAAWASRGQREHVNAKNNRNYWLKRTVVRK